MQAKYDYIIAGHGLAGALLAYELEQRGQSVLVVDHYNRNSSSNVAAGIIHPITGRRLVKTWLFDTAYPLAMKTYSALESKFGVCLFTKLPIAEIFTSVKNRNDWLERSAVPGFEHIIGEELPPDFNTGINCIYGGIKINSSGFLQIKNLINASSDYLHTQNRFIRGLLNSGNIYIDENIIKYNEFTASQVIFCEGYSANTNLFFQSIPFQPSKGEIITVVCNGLNADYIINKSIFILPLGNNLYRVGSTYQWDSLNEIVTESALEYLKSQFESIVKLPYQLADHSAGIRPTIKNRRPVIGMSASHPNIGIFNGLGTKGVLLAPLLASVFADQLVYKKRIPYDLYNAADYS